MSSYFVVNLKLSSTSMSEAGFALEGIVESLTQEIHLNAGASFLGASEVLASEPGLQLHEAQPSWIRSTAAPQNLEFYFDSSASAEFGAQFLLEKFPGALMKIRQEENQDWNALWRSQFKGLVIEPCWQILPIWEAGQKIDKTKISILMNPSLGFGTGEHPTTQLCLNRMGEWINLSGKRLLDFGSGSGILSVASALRGARVNAVEIDELALESSRELFQLNKVADQIEMSRFLKEQTDTFDFVVANILRSTLLQFSQVLIDRLKPGGTLLISGLLHDQVEEVSTQYVDLWKNRFGTRPHQSVRRLDQWASVEFSEA